MSEILFETARLRCRRWLPTDLERIYEVYSDPVAMRWVGDGTPITPEECEEWLRVTERNYAQRGYGMFALEDRRSGEVIGFCGLVHPDGQLEAEIKYAFLQSSWGQGLASEMIPALLSYAAHTFGLKQVIATVAPDNLASQRVLTKAGAKLSQKLLNEDGTTTYVFVWDAPESTNKSSTTPV